MSNISRRDFLKGAAAGLGSAVAMSMIGTSAFADEEAKAFEQTIEWDAEYDVIVAGYGAAGAAAAISAAENGAKVLLMEKAIKPLAGGNSRFGQNFMAFTDRDMAIQYYKNMRGEYTEIQGDDVIEFLVDGFMTFNDWLLAHGVPEDQITYAKRPEWPELYPDEEKTGFRKITIRPDMRFNPQDVNSALETFRTNVENLKDSIDVWYGAPAESLIQDPTTKIIHGVKTTINGTEYKVRAKNGVVLATGGFENNKEMIQNFTSFKDLLAKGCLYNTGDGVVMAEEVGAQLWHMSNLAAPDPNFHNPYTGCSQGWSCAARGMVQNGWYGDIAAGSAIMVAGDGTRFMDEAADETFTSRHGQTDWHGTWVHGHFPDKAYLIFDEANRAAGRKPYFSFSDGLETEIENGWILKADTIAELGEMIGIDGEAISTSIERYNGMCEKGVDEDFARRADYLVAFSGEGPYYAMEIHAAVTNTDGGAKRNTKCEVLNPRNEAIGHLYSAGSFGSFWVGAYNGGGNMGENYVTGTEAGKNAAAVKDDTVQESCLTKDPVNFADDYSHYECECTANQYLGRHVGMNGELTVRVTVDGETITNVEVVDHNETPNVGTMAVEQMPQRIIDAQSTIVDTVAGATRTSASIILATEQALTAAGIELQTAEDGKGTLQ